MNEKNFEDILCRYPELIEEGLNFYGRQVKVKDKYVDLIFIDRHGQKLITEIKFGTIVRHHIAQLLDYEGFFLSPDDPTVRVMMIGNRVPENLRRALDHHGFEWREITLSQLTVFLKKKNDTRYLEYVPDNPDERPVIKEGKHEKVKEPNSLAIPIIRNDLVKGNIASINDLEIKSKLVGDFRRRIEEELSNNGIIQYTFPSGNVYEGLEFIREYNYGILSIMVPQPYMEEKRQTYIHFTSLRKKTIKDHPDFEINISFLPDRRVSTCLVRNNEDIMFCSRGRFTVGKGAIKKEDALNFFNNKKQEILKIDDGGKEASVIYIAKIQSSLLFDEIAEFVLKVNEMKTLFREQNRET